MVNIKLAILPLSCLLVAALVHATPQVSSGLPASLGGIINQLPSTLKNITDALPLKQIADTLTSNGGLGGLIPLVLNLLLTVLSLPVGLIGIVITLVLSLLATVIGVLIALLKAL